MGYISIDKLSKLLYFPTFTRVSVLEFTRVVIIFFPFFDVAQSTIFLFKTIYLNLKIVFLRQADEHK